MKTITTLAGLAFIMTLLAVPCRAGESALIFAADFSKVPEHKKVIEVAPGVKRRTTFGKWELVGPNTLRATNIPEDNHGPVLVYEVPINNAVLTCDFKIPKAPAKNRHFRIFLDHPDYGGHTLNATANISSVFRPVGLTLQHLQKDKKTKKLLVNLEFKTVEVDLKPGQWHTMKVTLIDDYAKVEIDGKTMTEGSSEHLNVTKNKIGLNPGIAGGEIRDFKIMKAPKK
jgi:hypothetical protein